MTLFSEKLDGLAETIARVSRQPAAPLAAALKAGGAEVATAIGSGGSAVTAAYLASCRRTLGFPPTIVVTPSEFVLAAEQARGGTVWLFSGSGENADILAAFDTAARLNVSTIHVVTSRPEGELAQRAGRAGANVHLAPVGDARDGFLATHTLVAGITVLLLAAHIAAGGDEGEDLGAGFAAAAADLLASGPRARLARAFSGLRASDVIFLLQDPRLSPAAILVETSCWEAGLCPVQRVDFRNFAHGRHVWAAHRAQSVFVLALTAVETRAMWSEIDGGLPTEIRRHVGDYADAGRFMIAIGVLDALTFVEAVGVSLGVDPARPGVSDFGRTLFASDTLASLSRQLSPAVRAKRSAVTRQDAADTKDQNLLLCAEELNAIWSTTDICGIVLDFDGTIVATEDRFDPIRDDIAEALSCRLAAGLKLAIATGRGKSAGEALRNALPDTQHADVLIGYYNGACVRALPVRLADAPPASLPEIDAAFAWLTETGRMSPEKIKSSGVQLTLTRDATADIDQLALDLSAAGHSRLRLVQSSHTVDICLDATCKTAVVEALAAKWGLVVPSILRIGDSGGPRGNDHALLASEMGVTVGQTCGRLRQGWPLLGADVSGPDALLRILNSLVPLPGGRFRLDLRALEACD